MNHATQASLLTEVSHLRYLGANVQGEPRTFVPYVDGLKLHRDIGDEVASHNYRGFVLG